MNWHELVGKKVYCYKELFGNFTYRRGYYIVEQYDESDETICISCPEKKDYIDLLNLRGAWFALSKRYGAIGKSSDKLANFSDYFLTLSEVRNLKLKKLKHEA